LLLNYLLIQGPEVETPDLKEIAKLCGASRIEGIGNNAFRLHDYQTQDSVAAYCAGAKLDFAFVPVPRKLSDFGLVAMDMDSTLITIECIDEIADLHGIKPRVAAITASAMRGEIDYPESLRRRVALLAGLDESALVRVYEERLRLSPGAERMLERLRALEIRTLLVSSGFTFFTERLKTRLALDYTLSNTLEIKNRKLTGKVLGDIVDAKAKAARVRKLRDGLKLTREQIIAIGDGANDLAMMAEAGVSIAYHAKPVVREKATYCFDYVGLDGLMNLYAWGYDGSG
jgi:phosphoserine phosphatase